MQPCSTPPTQSIQPCQHTGRMQSTTSVGHEKVANSSMQPYSTSSTQFIQPCQHTGCMQYRMYAVDSSMQSCFTLWNAVKPVMPITLPCSHTKLSTCIDKQLFHLNSNALRGYVHLNSAQKPKAGVSLPDCHNFHMH